MANCYRVGVVRAWGLEEGIQKELSLEELPPLPTPANRARSRGWALQAEAAGGGKRVGGCVLGAAQVWWMRPKVGLPSKGTPVA